MLTTVTVLLLIILCKLSQTQQINFVRYKLSLDNSLSGSRSNIQAHYDLSNALFTTFLDTELLMYSSAIYDATISAPAVTAAAVSK
jgi:cyclopropane fatty-acyl-phospholipid synthase-like methyltransferase